ncbi:MAG: TonB-dependent receptor [Rhodothermales bacterium]|nr:TonB-dependent receptor [Rhodothermales bacterium]
MRYPNIMGRTVRIVLIAIGALGLWSSGAVVSEVAAQDSLNSQLILPNLTPREVEIRGDLVISFPSLVRQPLIGFNPPPRVPDIAPDRMPYVDEYKQSGDDLPDSPLVKPTPPPVTSLTSGDQSFGEVEATTGNYFNRTVRIRAGFPVSETSNIELDVDYHGSNGNEVFSSIPDVVNDYDTFEGRLDLNHSSRSFRARASIGGYSDAYNLYPVGSLINAPSFNLTPDRTVNGFGGELSLGTGTASRVQVTSAVGFGQYVMDTDLQSSGSIPDMLLERTEQNVTGRLGVTFPVGNASIGLDGRGGLNRLDSGDADEAENSHISGGLKYRTLIGNSVELSLGARILAISITEGSTRDASYVAPSFRLTLSPNPWVDVYASNDPMIENNTITTVTRSNPYVIDQPALEPVVYPINAETGVKIYSGPIRVVGRAGYQVSPNFKYFRRATTAEISEAVEAFSAISYSDASILSGGGDISIALPGRLSFTLGGKYRYAQFENSDDPVPYVAPITGRVSLAYNDPNSRFAAEIASDYTGKRFVDRSKSNELHGYSSLNLSAIYNVNSHLGIAARVNNVFSDDLESWENYLQSPVRVAAGLRLLW